MRERQADFEAAGARVAAVGLATREHARHFREETGIAFPLLVDEKREAYAVASLRKGTPFGILRPANARARARAAAAGHRQVGLGRNPFQLGGSFVLGPGDSVRFAHVSAFFGDNAGMDELLAAVRGAGPSGS